MKSWKPKNNHSDTILEKSDDKTAKILYSCKSKLSQITEFSKVKLERQKDELGSDRTIVL